MVRHYLAHGVRSIRSSPVASSISVLTLALGLVSILAAYAFRDFWAHSDERFANVDRIHVLTMSIASRDGFYADDGEWVPEQAAQFLRVDFPQIERIARAIVIDRNASVVSDGAGARLVAVGVDPDFLRIFDLPFLAGDSRRALDSPGSVVLTERYARILFGDQDPIGKHVVVQNIVDATVTGVIGAIREPSHFGRTPRAVLPFDLLASNDVRERIVAATVDPALQRRWTENWLGQDGLTYLLLPKTGLSAEALTAQLENFAARHILSETLKRASYRFGVEPLRALLTQSDVEIAGVSPETALLLLGALVLGIACANYASLATTRSVQRAREVGVRKALGASPAQIAAQSLVEAALLTTAALAVAIVLLLVSARLLTALLGVDPTPTLLTGRDVWPFLFVLSIGVTLAAGFYPSFVLAHVDPSVALEGSQTRLGSKALTALLVGSQFAIASFLLIAVAIVTLANERLERAGLGTTEDPLVVIDAWSHVTGVQSATLVEQLLRVPQVKEVAGVNYVPWEMLAATPVKTSPDAAAVPRGVITRAVGAGFFDLFGIKLLAGRLPGDSGMEGRNASPDANKTAVERDIVVDRTFVAEFGFASPADAVGKLVFMAPPPGRDATAQPLRIVGVVENRVLSFGKFGRADATMYRFDGDSSYTIARIHVHDVAGALRNIDAAWKRLAPHVAISRRFLDDVFNKRYERYLRINRLAVALAGMALVISVSGLVGMATLIVGRRRREIGVRKSFGATTAQMIQLLLTTFSKPVVAASLVAWPVAFVAARVYLNRFLDPIPLTLWPFVASLLVTLAVAALAVSVQTLRAARLNPADVLRHG